MVRFSSRSVWIGLLIALLSISGTVYSKSRQNHERIESSEPLEAIFFSWYSVFPKNDAGRTATLYLQNNGSSTSPYLLRFYSTAGVAIASVEGSIPPNDTLKFSASEISNLSDGTYHLYLAAPQNLNGVAVVRNRNTGSLGTYRGNEGDSDAQYFGPLFKGDVHSMLKVVDTFDGESVQVEFIGLDGITAHSETRTVESLGSETFDLSNIDDLPSNFSGWARVTAAEPVVGLLAQVGPNNTASYHNRLQQSESTQVSASTAFPQVTASNGESIQVLDTVYLPRALKREVDEAGQSRTTQLFIGNLSVAPTNLAVNYESAAGVSIASATHQLTPFGGMLLDPTAINTLANSSVHAIHVASIEPVVIGEFTTFDEPSSSGSDAYGSSVGTQIILPHVQRNGGDYTLFSVQNIGGDVNDVLILYYDRSGTLIYSETVQLEANGWMRFDLRYLSALGSTFEGSAVVSADQPVLVWTDEYEGVTASPPPIPTFMIELDGPMVELSGSPIDLSASVDSNVTTAPVAFGWKTKGTTSMVLSSDTNSGIATLNWERPGLKEVGLTVTDQNGQATKNVLIAIAAGKTTIAPTQIATFAHIDSPRSTTISVPTNTVTSTVELVFVPINFDSPSSVVEQLTQELFAGQGFDLLIMDDGVERTDFQFLQPLGIKLAYADIRADKEEELELRRWDGTDWVDAATTCSPTSAYRYNPQDDTVEVALCQSGRYILVRPADLVFLPIIPSEVAIR